jgi:hypothetical protein
MLFFATIINAHCDEFAPRYTTQFFSTRDALDAYLVMLEDYKLHSSGELTEEQREYYSQLVP